MVVNVISEMALRFGETKRDQRRDQKVFRRQVKGPVCREDEPLSGLEETIQVRTAPHPPATGDCSELPAEAEPPSSTNSYIGCMCPDTRSLDAVWLLD